MKRLEIIILSILFLLSTSGVSVNQHYCGGELISVSINDFTIHQPSGMDRGATRIDGRNARRGNDNHALGGMVTHIFQKGGLAGACLSGEKYADSGVLHEIPSLVEFLIEGHNSDVFLLLSCKDTTILNRSEDNGDIFYAPSAQISVLRIFSGIGMDTRLWLINVTAVANERDSCRERT